MHAGDCVNPMQFHSIFIESFHFSFFSAHSSLFCQLPTSLLSTFGWSTCAMFNLFSSHFERQQRQWWNGKLCVCSRVQLHSHPQRSATVSFCSWNWIKAKQQWSSRSCQSIGIFRLFSRFIIRIRSWINGIIVLESSPSFFNPRRV